MCISTTQVAFTPSALPPSSTISACAISSVGRFTAADTSWISWLHVYTARRIHKSRPAAHVRSLVDRYDIRRGLRQSKQDVSACRRRWRTFDYDGFITELQQSRLVLDPPEDVNQLVECYDTTLTTLLDRFAPARPVRLKARPSAPWYDAECRQYKAVTRKLETAY